VADLNFYTLDDVLHTEHNINLDSASALANLWIKPYKSAYMPFAHLIWAGQAKIARTPFTKIVSGKPKYYPQVFHLFNLVFHLISVCLVFLLLAQLLKHAGAALMGSLLFALHPLQVESVCWITGMRDVLAGVLSFGSVLLYLKFTQRKEKFLYYMGALVLFIFAITTKISALILPLIVLSIATLIKGRGIKETFKEMIPWFLIGGVIFVIALDANNTSVSHTNMYPGIADRFLLAANSLYFYVSKLFWPHPLAFDYGYLPGGMVKDPKSYVVLALLFFALFGVIRWRKRVDKVLLCGSLIFIVGLLPVLGFVPFIFQHISTVADRYLLISFLGVGLVFGRLFLLFPNSVFRTVMMGSIVLMGLKTHSQIGVWETDQTLYENAVKVNPNSWLATNNLGLVYEQQANWPKAIYYYKRSTEILPTTSGYNNLGAAYVAANQYLNAEWAFQNAIRLQPTVKELRYNLKLVQDMLAKGKVR